MIVFENKPSTKTPVNDKNLNANFKELKEALYYKDGDTFIIPGVVHIAGGISGSAKSIIFSLVLPKSLEKISDITLNSYDITVRPVEGGYILNRVTSGLTTQIVKRVDNIVTVQFNSETAFDTTNNTPCLVSLYSLSLTFNE